MNHNGKSPATVTRSTASIKSFYNYMVQTGAVRTNPAKSVVAMKVERKYPEILTNREVELFLEQPKCVDEKASATTPCWSCCTPPASASRS